MSQVRLGIRGVKLWAERGLSGAMLRYAVRIVRALARVSPVADGRPLWITLYPKQGLTDPRTGLYVAPAVFIHGKRRRPPTRLGEIHVACHWLGDRGWRLANRFSVREFLLHEWAHYEQWRDARKIQERGVRVRAKTLGRLIRESA